MVTWRLAGRAVPIRKPLDSLDRFTDRHAVTERIIESLNRHIRFGRFEGLPSAAASNGVDTTNEGDRRFTGRVARFKVG